MKASFLVVVSRVNSNKPIPPPCLMAMRVAQQSYLNGDVDGAFKWFIGQVKFAEIRLNHEIHASALEPSYSTEHFTWLRQPSAHAGTVVEAIWGSDELPAGFRVVSVHEETMEGSDEEITHMLYSDGLANVSVFIAAKSGKVAAGSARVGGSNSYGVEHGDFEITVIGEVPAVTVEQIATSMRQR